MRLSKKCFYLSLVILSIVNFNFYAQNNDSFENLVLTPNDVRMKQDKNGGFHLFVKQKDGIGSVMLVESVSSPNSDADNYAYRAKEWNSVNGDEKRILAGKELNSDYARYSIVDSTPESNEELGKCFHLYVPETIVFGYPWARNGEVKVEKGTFFNIRTYEKPYADYSGKFYDNPFVVNYKFVEKPKPVVVEPEPEPEVEPEPEPTIEVELNENYNSETANTFQDLANMNDDLVIISSGPETLIDDILKCIRTLDPSLPCDIVFAIDATGSMKDDIEKLRLDLIQVLEKELSSYIDVRLGLLLYRDYSDNFRYKDLPIKVFSFTKDLKTFKKNLNGFKIKGNEGGDIPEAVYEALYGSIQFYDWGENSQKKIILIGDAPPHSRPRGSKIVCSKEVVQKLASKNDIHIDTIILPDK